jgi:aminobenzoyl-glutamate transport protein
MVCVPSIVVVAQQYTRDAGPGTVISLMIPFAFVVLIAWLAFFVIWFLLGLPMGPACPANL